MRRILFFVDRLLRGGIQSFLKVVCSNLPKDKFDISILVLDDGKDYSELEKEFVDVGVKLYKLDGIWLTHFSDYKEYKNKLDDFFSLNQFDIVHINSGPKNYVVAKYAKKHNVKKIIYHSHNTNYQTKNLLKKIYGNYLKFKVKKYCTHYLACSYKAAEWLFFKKTLKSSNFEIIHNPISVDDFAFNQNKRNVVRNEFGLGNDFVIGNIGRFSRQKNQSFLVEVVSELSKIYPNVKLAFVGCGELEQELKKHTEELHIMENVVFFGFRKDVETVINSFDLFVLTSLYEGYPIVSIEAQANGLPCLMSNTITEEALLKENSNMLDLKSGPKNWANFILSNYINKPNKRIPPENINEYGCDYIVNQLIEFYDR